eukprot:NODE_353_length_8928_cov_0.455204.p11 type:complete len:105 gc:universal NODE_353_length_8928_cov_0.455204:5263-5577(+)
MLIANEKWQQIEGFTPFKQPKMMTIGTICRWKNCNQTFQSQIECHKHSRKIHLIKESKKCEWQDCSVVCSSRCNLSNHLLSHFNIIKAKCGKCQINFKWKGIFD